MVVDALSFNGEFELWDLHYRTLESYVDQFILCEAATTFSGETKPLYMLDIVAANYPKARFFQIDENWTEEEKQQAWDSPNTVGAAHFTREFLQKESIKKALTHLNDNDIVFIGDVDEIWQPKALKLRPLPLKLKLAVYTYYLNNRSTEQFWGTLMATYGQIKNQCLNHLRTNAPKSRQTLGWHFTSMGGPDALKKKLTDSYTEESYATPYILQAIDDIYGDKDFLGRNFSYTRDETGWPQYLKNNRANYHHLLMTNGTTGKSENTGPEQVEEKT